MSAHRAWALLVVRLGFVTASTSDESVTALFSFVEVLSKSPTLIPIGAMPNLLRIYGN